MSRKLKRIVTAEEEGVTVERYLRDRMGFTPAQIRGMKFRPNGIQVNGERSRVTRKLSVGDMVELLLEDERKSGEKDGSAVSRRRTVIAGPGKDFDGGKEDGRSGKEISQARVVPSGEAIEVLYEDEDVIAVWKPAGIVAHPGHGHYRDSLANRLQGYLMRKESGKSPDLWDAPETVPFAIRSIGRLDRDTSGILVFGKNRAAAQRLWEQREQGIFRKEYLALCRGVFPEEARHHVQTIDAPIGKQEGALNKMCVTGNGKPAVTRYQVLEQYRDTALLRLSLETGRTHQIRVHMAYMGHPLLGDPIYDPLSGGNCFQQHMLLCAWYAEFNLPFTEITIRLSRFPAEQCGKAPFDFSFGLDKSGRQIE